MKIKIFGVAILAVFCARADIVISPSSIDYAMEGGGAAVKTSGSGTWEATTDVDWITLVKTSGTVGISCTYVVSRNNSADVREEHITISGNIYTVSQKGCPITLTPASVSADKKGSTGKITISVDAGVTWTATPSDSWITITPISGAGAAELSYTVAENNVVGSRTGTIRIGSEKFTITQAGIDVTLSLVTTNITKDVCIVPVQVVALSETKWKVVPNVSWISVLDGGNGYGGSQVTLAVAENPSFEKRIGTVTIGSAEFTVIQTGTDDVNFKILPEVATASPRGAFANVAVYATPDASWTAESMDSWIKITEGASGAGNGNVKYVTMSNPELEARTGHIKFIPPVAVPDLDLYSGMILWITQKSNIEGNEARQFEYDLSKTFDGSFINELSGTNFPANSTGDFTLSMSVSVSTLDQINRLFTFGSKSIYLTAENELMANSDSLNFTFSKSDKFYTIVLRYTAAEDKCEYYVGERDSELKFCAVLSGTGAPIDLTQAISPNVLKLGYCPYPSFGYLDNGRMDNVRFWARLLTDRECECVDMVSEVLNNSQAGIPSSVTYHYFAMGGNAMCTSEANKMPSIGNLAVTSSYCNVTEGRDRIRCGAVESDGQAKIIINGFANIFKGEDILNNGYDFDDTYDESLGGEYYWVEDRGTSYKLRFPYEVKATEDSEFDATYVLWLNIKALPAEGNVTILKRYLRTASKYAYEHQGKGWLSPYSKYYSWRSAESLVSNENFSVSLTSAGHILLQGSSVEDTQFEVRITTNAWHMLSVVGKNKKSIQVYVDDTEIGNVPSGLTLGYLPKLSDWRYRAEGYTLCDAIITNKFVCSVGGWNGALDSMCFYGKALSAKEIKDIFKEEAPEPDILHTVNQGIQEPSITPDEVEISKFGGTANISLSVARTINWAAVSNDDWLSIVGDTSGTGPATIMVKAAANTTCLPRTGTVTIGTKTLVVQQPALDCAISVNKTIFPTEADDTGGMGVVQVNPEGNGSWTAECDVSWIYCYPESGTGSSDVYFFVEDMGSTAACRSGTITIGGQTIEITQRGYELSIDPQIAEVGGNAGAGVIGVSADADAVWTAIADVPWISIVKTTSGAVQYTFTDNTTGETRIGHINIAGATYTLTQTCKLDLTTTIEGKGTITGGGKYAQGTEVTLIAQPATGYEFSHWSGDVVGVEASTSVIMDSVKNVTATFIPESAAKVLVEKKAAQGGFYTRDQIHNLEVGNLTLDVDSSTGKARIGVQLQETSDLSNPDWKPVNVGSGDLDIGADGTVGIKAGATGNAKFFRVVVPRQ